MPSRSASSSFNDNGRGKNGESNIARTTEWQIWLRYNCRKESFGNEIRPQDFDVFIKRNFKKEIMNKMTKNSDDELAKKKTLASYKNYFNNTALF